MSADTTKQPRDYNSAGFFIYGPLPAVNPLIRLMAVAEYQGRPAGTPDEARSLTAQNRRTRLAICERARKAKDRAARLNALRGIVPQRAA